MAKKVNWTYDLSKKKKKKYYNRVILLGLNNLRTISYDNWDEFKSENLRLLDT